MKLKIITVVTVIMLLVAMSVPVYADTVIPDPPTDAWEYWVYLLKGSEITFATSHYPITTPKGTYEGETLNLNCGKYYKYIVNEWDAGYESNYYSVYFKDYVIVAANHDIAYEDGSGFFFLRPKVSPIFQTMKETDSGTILRNFSAGLIPIVGLIVLAIALMKGWRFLRAQFRT